MLTALVLRTQQPRGIRNNNPGNIRRTNTQWRGIREIQSDNAFVQFNSPEYGHRAMARVLRSYERRGLVTVRDIISTYAPATENKTEAYIDFVAKRLGVSPDAQLDLDVIMFDLIKAITVFENGQQYASFYDDATIRAGIALA